MTTTDRPRIGAVLLAGGASRGLGHPKQLVVYKGKTLLRRAAEMLLRSACDPVIVVLGAVVEPCVTEIEDLPIRVCINDQWDLGMSSSIRSGLRELVEADPRCEAALIALVDQPFIDVSDIHRLIDRFEKDRNIVAAGYDDVAGVPAIFPRSMFGDLAKLEGDLGARYLIRKHLDQTAVVRISGAGFDVDTPADLNELHSRAAD